MNMAGESMASLIGAPMLYAVDLRSEDI